MNFKRQFSHFTSKLVLVLMLLMVSLSASCKTEEEKKTLQETYDNSMAELRTEVDYWVEQANKLMDFYGEPLAVVAAVGMYFDKRLKYKITKAQKK